MNSSKLEQIHQADEGSFYDTRDMNFEMDKVAAMDDYGLSRVPGKWRFSPWQALLSMSGLSTALAYPLMGALLTLSFGAPAVIIGFLISALIVGAGTYYMAKLSANEGIGKDLMSRASLGYFGSVLTSLLPAIFIAILFALESSIMAHSLSAYVPILPYWASAALIVLAFIPLGIYGMILINKLQNFTLWLYGLGIVLIFIALYSGWSDQASAAFASGWWQINPSGAPLSWMTVLAATGAWLGAFGLLTIFVTTDIARMVHRKESKKGAVLLTVIAAVVNSVLIGLLGIFLLASTNMMNPDPGVTFVWLLGPFGLFLVLVTQFRANLLNMYFGTLAFESSIAQVANKSFNRAWLLVPYAITAYIMMITPFLEYFPQIASIVGAFLAAWVGAVLGEYLLVRRRFGIPAWREYRKAYLPSVNWIGFSALIFPAILGIAGILGALGPFMQAAGVLVTLVISFVLPAVIAGIIGKEKVIRQYFARIPEIPPNGADTMTCTITGETQHKSDFVLCPFHKGSWISSKACASETKCGKVCQVPDTVSNLTNQAHG